MLAGDWHGNLRWAFNAINYAAGQGADTILQLGDFGWWGHTEAAAQYLREVNKELEHHGITLYWVDGNHECHEYMLDTWNDPTVGVTFPSTVANYGKIWHLPRGFRWEWWGEWWMSLGGAHSVDRRARVEGESWWPGEWLTPEQVEFATRPGPVDVIVAHDAPYGLDIPGIGVGLPRGGTPFPYEELIAAGDHRKLVKQVVDETVPEVFFHGHYHRNYQGAYKFPGSYLYMKVIGLDRDDTSLARNTLFITEGALG